MIVFGIPFSGISRRNMEQPFVRNGITLLSPHDPVRRCEKTADAVAIKDRTLYFCPSPLYGWGVARFLSLLEKEAPGSGVLCIEADPELYELSLKNIEACVTGNSKFRITNITQAEELLAFVNDNWGARIFRRVEIIRFTGGWRLSADLYDSLCETLRNGIASDWSNVLTLTKLGRLYIRNAFRNLDLIHQYNSITEISFGDSPVLVMGAGPSLDETLDALAECFADTLGDPGKRAFRIVCVDTCLGVLKERDIKPDIAVILESQHWNLNDFIGCKGWEVSAAADLSALPQSTRVLGGQGFLFMTPWTNLRVFKRLREKKLLPAGIEPLGSVGLTAVEIARRAGSGKIIISGLDFSYTADKYHTRGTPGHRAALNTQSRFKRIVNKAAFGDYSFAAVSKSGISVKSDPVMRHYRDLFEQEFGGTERIFDIEGSGLPLGARTLSIEEAVNVLSQEQRVSGNFQKRKYKGAEEKKQELNFFTGNEMEMLEELKDILTGGKAADKRRLGFIIDECDYLWAHFPDFAGGLNADIDNLSFLKRLRAELDPMIDLLSAKQPALRTDSG